MEEYKIQIIKSVVSILILVIASRVFERIINNVGEKFSYDKSRKKIVKKVITTIIFCLWIGILLLIWGIAPSQLAGYIASLFTVVGVAFLAQWSIVSNITSTLIIFFNHQVNIGDTIEVLSKDYPIRGTISDIGIFFIIIKVNRNEYVSMPSNVFMQSMVKKIKN